MTKRRVVGGSIVLLVIVVGLVIFARRGGEEEPPVLARGGEALPVILVHGYGGAPASMEAIEQRLRSAGREVVSLQLPDGGMGDILESARAVDEAVRATGSDTVDLIGFSLGGVVVRTYVAELDGAAHARYVITLAAPHHGTDIAGLAVFADPGACTGACRQLAPDSEFLTELNDTDETPDGPAFVAIWTDRDQTVTPPDSAELDGAVNIKIQDVCPGAAIDHGELVRDPVVLGVIVETLSGRLTGVPGSDRCQPLTELGRAA